MAFKIKAPNPRYRGVTEGVAFADGIGVTEDENTRNVLVNDYKYEDITPEKEQEKPLEEMSVAELKKKAKDLQLSGYSNLNRDELLSLIKGEPIEDDNNESNDGDDNQEDSDPSAQ